MNPFDQIPGDARLYVFGSSRKLDEAETRLLLEEVDRFLSGWTAHKQALAAARDWRHGRFLLVAADENVTSLSGCSIDSLVRHIKSLEPRFGATFVDSEGVYYRAGGSVERLSRAGFARLVESGGITADTMVFDNTIRQVSELRAGRWERPFGESWHARAFPLPAAAVRKEP